MDLRTFDFEHRIFQIEGAYFFRSKADDRVLLHVSLGEQDAAIFTDTLTTEFGIKDDSKDASLLRMVERALRFVKFIAPGDAVPSEIIDGTASWKIEEHHYKRAKDRLMIYLASWVTGRDPEMVDMQQLSAMMEDPDVQAQIQDGFTRAAVALGLEKSKRETVVGMIEQLSRELAYVEALRDHYQRIIRVERDLKIMQARFAETANPWKTSCGPARSCPRRSPTIGTRSPRSTRKPRR